jgi:hypothetical protein
MLILKHFQKVSGSKWSLSIIQIKTKKSHVLLGHTETNTGRDKKTVEFALENVNYKLNTGISSSGREVKFNQLIVSHKRKIRLKNLNVI